MNSGQTEDGSKPANSGRETDLPVPVKLCACGCGEQVKTQGSRYLRGHNSRGQAFRQYASSRMKAQNPMGDPITVQKAVTHRPADFAQRVSTSVKASYARGERLPNIPSEQARQRSRERMRSQNPMADPSVVATVKATREARGVGEASAERLKTLWQDPAFRQAQSERMKRHNPMEIPTVREASIKRLRLLNKPSKLEAWFTQLCEANQLPIWYTGAGQFWVDNHNPDYKIHDRKMVIELTDGWRTKPEERRNSENYGTPILEYYRRHGFTCLVLFVPAYAPKRDRAVDAILSALRTYLTSEQSMICDTSQLSL